MGYTRHSENTSILLTLKPNGGYIKIKLIFAQKWSCHNPYRLYDNIREQIPTYNLNLYNQGDFCCESKTD